MPVVKSHSETVLHKLTEGSNQFAIELYQAVKKPNENLIVSPISVQMVLALAYAGAKEDTAKQIADVLHLPESDEVIFKAHQELNDCLKNSSVLKLATKMFVEKTMNVKKEFQDTAKKYFHSEAGAVDFLRDAEGARKEINHYVEEKTNKKIQDLIAEDVLTSLTRMVLINAVHFKANWASKFNPDLTYDGEFYTDKDNKVPVKMMTKKSKFRYTQHDELKAKILELPYADKEFKMILILPNEIDGLTEVENKLTTFNLHMELLALRQTTVNVEMPRFKIEKTVELSDILMNMGIKDLFDENKSNLTGISAEQRLYVSNAIQKAFIEVNEEGTEAAAATGFVIQARSMFIPQEEEFIVDHPFIAYIFYKREALPMFVSRVCNV